jgi:outer membrane protein assembly factor BamB
MRRFLILVPVALLLAIPATRADDWPQWMGTNRDGIWAEKSILDKFPKGGPKEVWRKKIYGGYSGPAVAGGLVYVMDYETKEDIRKLSTFTRPKTSLKGKERILGLDAKTGKEVWKHQYDCPYTASYPTGPRCTPTVTGGKVYTLGSEGNLCCLDAKKGDLLWSKDFNKDYKTKTPFWGYTGHPLVDGNKLVCLVGGKDSLLVAFDKDTGKELWKSLDAKEPGYCPPSIITAGGKRQLLIWAPERIHSVDPETGKPYWSVDLKPGNGMSIMAPQKSGNYLFTGGFGPVGLLLELDGTKEPKEVWRGNREKGIGPVNSTPLLEGGTMYGVDQPGQLRAVDIVTGKRLWETFEPTTGKGQAGSGTAFLVKNGDRHFIFGENGVLTIAKLSRKGYEKIDSAKLLEPTGFAFGRDIVWSHPAFADKCVFVRNDKEIVCYSLAAE